MCGWQIPMSPTEFAIRAIAAGAGGRKLADWALAEEVRRREAEDEFQREQERLWQDIKGVQP